MEVVGKPESTTRQKWRVFCLEEFETKDWYCKDCNLLQFIAIIAIICNMVRSPVLIASYTSYKVDREFVSQPVATSSGAGEHGGQARKRVLSAE
jgi:hypothetical protein